MNIKYRIKSSKFDKNSYIEYLKALIALMNSNRKKLENINDINNKEQILKKELDYKMFINYSIFRYKSLRNYPEIEEEGKNIINLNLVEDSLESIKNLITSENKITNNDLIKKLIYENILNIYIQFCFLEYNKDNYEQKKINFLDTFLLLLKESNNSENKIPFINEAIVIFFLQIIVQFFNNNDKSQTTLEKYLVNNNLFKYLLELKFEPNDAHSSFYDNQFKFFVTLEESFKQFIIKIFSEKNIFEHLLENVMKYAFANINPNNNEVDLEGFVDFCKDYIKIDNKDIFVNTIKKLFFIVSKEKIEDKEDKDKEKEKEKDKEKEEKEKEKEKEEKEENEKIYILRLKPEYQKEIDNIKEELNRGELNQKVEDELKSKKTKSNKSKVNNTTRKNIIFK